MAIPLRRAATYVDLQKVPPGLVAEIVDGDLYTSPRPLNPHAKAASSLQAFLNFLFDRGTGGPGGWHILMEPELHIVGQVMVPDVAGWRRSKLPVLPRGVANTIAPDWLCEVASASTRDFDRLVKMPRYAEAGVEWVWLVEPGDRTIAVCRRDAGTYKLNGVHEGDAVVALEPFEAMPLELKYLWDLGEG